jgi:signal transduction histidine kinase
MPATGSRVARSAFARLMVRCAVGLRLGSAVAAGIAAFAAGLAPPATVAAVAPAVAVTVLWSAAYAVLVGTGRAAGWPVAVDVAVAAGLGLALGHLVPAVLADATGWVFLYASTTVIITPLVSRAAAGVAASLAVPAAYAVGLWWAPGVDPPGGAVLLLVQGVLVTALMTVLRRAATAADTAVLQHEATQRQAAVLAARRADEREHYRLLHDSVSATLTVVAAGGIDAGSASLPAQARRDLAVIERLNAPDPAGAPDLRGWLGPVVAGRAVVAAPIPDVPVPAAVGAALAGAATEALTNAARYAAPAPARLAAAVETDGAVTVRVADDGPGFDPAAVPESRRGVRESVVGRMRSVQGDATVASRPGGGTEVLLRWPAGPDGAGEPGEPAMLGEVIATRYRRGFDLVVILLVGVWHVGNDLLVLLSGWGDYRSPVAELLSWLALAAVGAVAGARLRRGRAGRPVGTWLLAGAALAAGAVGIAAVPEDLLFSGTNWAWGAVGWFGVLILLRRPPRELGAFLVATAAIAVAMLAGAGALDRTGVARAATVIYGTAALQLTLLLAARGLAATARRAAAVAGAESAVRRQRQVAERLHADRRQRYRTVRAAVAPLLAGLADGTLDPADPSVRHRCAVEASRLRRLFAETDDVADPLLHELRACSYIADQRGVVVDLQLTGRLPALDREVRRALTEAPLLALAGAERRARVTVLGRTDEVAVSVLVDGRGPAPAERGPVVPQVTVSVLDEEDRRWVEARWRR